MQRILKTIASDLFSIGMMATVGVCCGFAMDQFRNSPLPMVYSPKAERIQHAVAKISLEAATSNLSGSVADTESRTPEVSYVDLKTFREIVEGKTQGIVLDARPAIFYQLGHIPGAMCLPREEFEASYNKQRSRLEIDKSRTIAVYCSDSSCEDSQMVADALVKLSYSRVFVFKGGWSDWTTAHLPEEKGQQ